MDLDLVLIFAFILTALTIVGISINGIVDKVLRHRRWNRGEADEGQARVAEARTGELASRTDLIEDRLRVLERLATDRGALLADEIEALRDNRLRNEPANREHA